MSGYRRNFSPGGCFFFTVVSYQRLPIFATARNVELLREGIRQVMRTRPFEIQAMVVLPDHLHTLWRLPDGDCDYSKRWRDIKHYVSLNIDTTVNARGEKAVWQRRFWEHTIRDDADWRRHLDYIHYNPVKHGLAASPQDWPYSSFAKAIKMGWYPRNWGSKEPDDIKDWRLE